MTYFKKRIFTVWLFLFMVFLSFFKSVPVWADAKCCIKSTNQLVSVRCDAITNKYLQLVSGPIKMSSFSPASECRVEGSEQCFDGTSNSALQMFCGSENTHWWTKTGSAIAHIGIDYDETGLVTVEKEVPCDYSQRCIQETRKLTDCSQSNNQQDFCLNNPNCFYYDPGKKCYNKNDSNICGELNQDYCGEAGAGATNVRGSVVCSWDNTTGGIGSCTSRVNAGLTARYARTGGWLPACAYSGNCRSINDLVEVAISVVKQAMKYIGALAFLMFVYGGITMIVAFGNAEKFEHGKKVLVAAVVGIIISFSAYILVDFILTSLQVSGGIQGL